MTQISYFWNGDSVGHAAGETPYSYDKFSRNILARIFGRGAAVGAPYSYNFVIKGYQNGLQVTKISDSQVQVATGAALVDSVYYRNTDEVDVAIGADGWYYVVLRKDSEAQTVRVGSVGPTGGTPTLTKDSATIYEVPLALLQKTGGVIVSVTDTRCFIRPEYRDLTANFTLLGSASSYPYDPIPPEGVATPPLFPLRAIPGCSTWTGSAAASGMLTVNLPVTFLIKPGVIATAKSNTGRVNVVVLATSTSQIEIRWFAHPSITFTSLTFMWLVFGKIKIGE